jgi:hypothetical protein
MKIMGETLIRLGGSRQAADINALFGFRIECIERLGDPHGIWAWTRLNALFNWLPLAASIEDKILCMHGGEYCSLLTVPSELNTPRCQFHVTQLMQSVLVLICGNETCVAV